MLRCTDVVAGRTGTRQVDGPVPPKVEPQFALTPGRFFLSRNRTGLPRDKERVLGLKRRMCMASVSTLEIQPGLVNHPIVLSQRDRD